jgi:tripartite-type tricarboxylate transporter receptor subunit TctC
MMRLTAVLLTSLLAVAAHGQDYPNRPIRIIVPFNAGDGLDLQVRMIGQQLTSRWKQQVLVDNRPGAGTMIGTEAGAKAAADGYTITLVTTSFAINPVLRPKVPYDPIKDFAPLMQTTATPAVLAAAPSLQAKNFKELMALAKQKPRYFTVGNAGVGTAGHIGSVLLEQSAGFELVHVPYKGIPTAILDLMSGQLQLLMTSPIQVLGPIREGKIKPIAVTGSKRMPHLPDVETIRESGAPYELYGWVGMVVPAGTPKEIIAKLNKEIGAILRSPELSSRFANEGAEVVASSPEAFGAYIRAEMDRWGKAIRAANITPQ